MPRSNPHLHALLFLPSPPQTTNLLNLSLAFSPPLAYTISTLSNRHKKFSNSNPTTPKPALLDIALLDIALPLYKPAHTFQPRNPVFTTAQTLLSNIYTLLQEIHSGASTFSSGLVNPFAGPPIPLSGPGAVDARVILTQDDDLAHPTPSYATTSLQSLATSYRSWTHIFHVDSPSGEQIHLDFTCITRGPLHVRLGPTWISERVPGGIEMLDPSLPAISIPEAETYNDALVCIEVRGPSNSEDTSSPAFLPFREKYLLTMALLTLKQPHPRDLSQKTLFVGVGYDITPRLHLVGAFLTALLDFPGLRQVSATSATVRAGSGVRSLHPILDLQRRDGLRCLVSSREFFVEGGVVEDVGVLVVEFEDGSTVGEVNSLRAEKGWGRVEVVSVGGLGIGSVGDEAQEREEEEGEEILEWDPWDPWVCLEGSGSRDAEMIDVVEEEGESGVPLQ